MDASRPAGDDQLFGDLRIAEPVGDQAEHFGLPRGQPEALELVGHVGRGGLGLLAPRSERLSGR